MTHIPVEELEKAVKNDASDLLSGIRLIWATGNGIVGEASEVDNAEFPEWNPTSVMDVILS